MKNIGLVGCGTHANWAVMPAIREVSDRWRFTAAVDVNADNLAKIDDADVAKFASHTDMIAAGGLDAVYIATLSDTHAQIAIDAMRAGLHVICEKPMATTASQCEEMVAVSKQTGKIIAIDFPLRYTWYYQRIWQWIQAGRLGRIEAFHEQSFWDGHKVFGEIGARRHRLSEKAGALDCGVHRADLARYFCGGNWKHVDARGRWFGETTKYPTHIGVLAELDNGVMVTLNSSFAYSAYIPPKAYSDVMTIVGSEGVINCFYDREQSASVQLVSRDEQTTLNMNDRKEGKAIPDILRDVADVMDGKPVPATLAMGEDGLEAQRFVDWANDAAVANRLEVTVCH